MLFIDANIYLEFYTSSQATIKKLLPSIESLKDEIFITNQIKNEVNRNKVKVASDSLRNHINTYKLISCRLPEHLEEEGEDVIEKWNQNSANLQSEYKKSHTNLSEIVEKLLLKINKHEDTVSISLNEVFVNALSETENELNCARLRKERGNPPGKPGDSLGDQISWEQLLSTYDGKEPLWIISKDNDYSSKVNKERFLNAFLFNEIKDKVGRDPNIYIFESLAEGLGHYSENREKPVDNLPAKDELEVIAANELIETKSWLPSNDFPPPMGCYKCGEKQGFNGPIPRPSQYGGWSYQWVCNACGEWNDFGEPYDE